MESILMIRLIQILWENHENEKANQRKGIEKYTAMW